MVSEIINVAQPILLGYSYEATLIKNKYTSATVNTSSIQTILTSYPYIRFSVPYEAQLMIPKTRKTPVNSGDLNEPELIVVSQVGSYVVISSLVPANKEFGWEPLLNTNGKAVIIEGEPVYKKEVVADDEVLQFIPPKAHIWGVLDLCTVDKLESNL